MDLRADDPRAAGTSGFDFTFHMRGLCRDICTRLAELAHVDMSRVAIRFCQARKAVRHGLHASLTPLRFEDGRLVSRRRGVAWTITRIFDADHREMLYLLSFYLPRFLDRPFENKLSTVVHELWHISPRFDGDLRRHGGRCWAHTHSQKQYDDQMRVLATRWLSLDPPIETYEFLRWSFRELQERHGPVRGQRIPTPKLIRASSASVK